MTLFRCSIFFSRSSNQNHFRFDRFQRGKRFSIGPDSDLDFKAWILGDTLFRYQPRQVFFQYSDPRIRTILDRSQRVEWFSIGPHSDLDFKAWILWYVIQVSASVSIFFSRSSNQNYFRLDHFQEKNDIRQFFSIDSDLDFKAWISGDTLFMFRYFGEYLSFTILESEIESFRFLFISKEENDSRSALIPI